MNVSSNTQKYYAGVQNACLQVMGRQGAFQTLEILLLSSKNPIFENINELTHKIKTAQKFV